MGTIKNSIKWLKPIELSFEASKRFDDSYIFLILGGKPHYVDNFRAAYPDRTNFMLMGHKSHFEIPLYLKCADVAVLPNSSKSEISRVSTSPMKLFEYMASGVPIVASDLLSIREILSEKNSVIVKPDSPEDLARGILGILKDTEKSKKIALQARIDVKKYTWDKRVVEISKFIE